MKTLKELLEGVELPVKVRYEGMKHKFFEVKVKNNFACLGTFDNGHDSSLLLSSTGWELYTEPKAKETWYEYLIDDGSDFRFCEWYKSDELFLDCNPNETIIKTGRSIDL